MATELAKAYVQIIPSARGIQGSLTKVLGGEAGSAGTSAGQTFGSNLVGKVLGIVSAAAIGKALASTITEGAALEQSIGGIETLFKDSADTVKANAAAAYSTAGMSANQYMEQTTSFAASLLQSLGGDTAAAADMADMAMRDMSDNSNKMGTDMERITDAYQGFAKQNYTMLDNLKLGYGGTKTEMERLLKDAQKITGVKYDIDNLADVYSAIHVIQGELDITGTTAQEAATTLSGSFYSMAAAGKNVLGNLTLGQDITPSLKALAQTTTTFLVGNLLPAVWNVLKALPGGVVTLVQEMGTQMAAQLPAFLAQFQTGMNTNLSQLIAAGQTMLSGLIAGLMQNLPQMLQSGTQMVNNFVSGALATGTQLWTAGLSLLTQFTQGITANLPQILASATSIVANLVTGLNTALPQVIQSGIAFLTVLGQGLVQGIPKILTLVARMSATLISGLLQKLPQIISAGFSLITALLQGIGQALPQILTSAAHIAATLISGLLQNLPQIISAGFSLITSLVQSIGQAIPQILAAGTSIPQNMVAGIGQALPQILTSAAQMVATLISGLLQNMPQIISAGFSLITALIQGIGQALPGIISAGFSLITALIQGIGQALPGIITAAVQAAQTLWEAFTGLNWPQLGMDILNGIINGIKSAMGALVDAAINAAKSAYNAVKDALDIHSPSRLFRDDIGKMIPAGMALGITDNLRPVTNAMRTLGTTTASMLQQDLAGMLGQSQRRMAALRPAAATTIQQYNTFNTHDSLSEAELTREAESMAKRLQWAIP